MRYTERYDRRPRDYLRLCVFTRREEFGRKYEDRPIRRYYHSVDSRLPVGNVRQWTDLCILAQETRFCIHHLGHHSRLLPCIPLDSGAAW